MFPGLVGSNRGQEQHLNSPTCIAECMQLDFWLWSSQSVWKHWIGWVDTQFSSVQFSHSVIYGSLLPHGLQHARLSCPSPTPRVYSNSCPLSQWCHPTTSSFVAPFPSYLQSFPESGSFPVSQLFASDGQSIGVSASTSVLPMNIQDWFKIHWLDLLVVQGTLKSLLQHHNSKASIPRHSAFTVQLSHPYMTTGKTIVNDVITSQVKIQYNRAR